MPIDGSIVEEYWRAIAGDTCPLPALPDDAVEAFTTLLLPDRLLADDRDDTLVEAALVRSIKDPYETYAGIAVAADPTEEMCAWAADIAELVAFTSPALPRHTWYLDRIADASDEHRVYAFMNEERVREFASIEDALRYLTAFIRYSERHCDSTETVEVEASLQSPPPWAWSGAQVFCRLRGLPLPDVYEHWSRRSWPTYEGQTTQGIDTSEPGAARIAMLAAVETMMRTRRLDTRNVDYSQMVDAHRTLVDHLRQLARAVSAGYPPKIIAELARGDHPTLGALAQAWLARFEASEHIADPDLAPPAADQNKALRVVLVRALQVLVADELVEVEEGAQEALIDELAIAVLEAFNPNHAVKKLRLALLNSDNVAEIYAADLVLDSAFREALGG